jgi:hypothetical protein
MWRRGRSDWPCILRATRLPVDVAETEGASVQASTTINLPLDGITTGQKVVCACTRRCNGIEIVAEQASTLASSDATLLPIDPANTSPGSSWTRAELIWARASAIGALRVESGCRVFCASPRPLVDAGDAGESRAVLVVRRSRRGQSRCPGGRAYVISTLVLKRSPVQRNLMK